jgi:hypothetical protein
VTPWPKALARYAKRIKAPLRIPIPRKRLLYDLPTYARRALSGEASAAMVLMQCWRHFQESGEPIPRGITAYLRVARRTYHKDPRKDRQIAVAHALGFMVGKKGRPPTSADRMLTAFNIVDQRIRKGPARQLWDSAVAEAANPLPGFLPRISERQVKTALSEARPPKKPRRS